MCIRDSVRSDQHCIDNTPEIIIGTEFNNEQQNKIQQLVGEYSDAVSYTHLDVYKRQLHNSANSVINREVVRSVDEFTTFNNTSCVKQPLIN